MHSHGWLFRPVITVEMCRPEGEDVLLRNLRGAKRVSFDEISAIREKGGPLTRKWQFALTKPYAYDITAQLNNARRLRFKLDINERQS